MKLLYTNENRLFVSNVKNIVECAGVEVILRNEFAGGGVGELSTIDSWLELWVVNDGDYEKANEVIVSSINSDNAQGWFCSGCAEKNDASFDYCWNCQTERT